MTDMIERVARVLCGLAPDLGTEQTGSADWQSFVPIARAILDVLREPTAAMREAGAGFFEEGDTKQNAFAAEIVYGAMMDAAAGKAA